MATCPQGCYHPVYGNDTMAVREERRPRETPAVIEHLGETVVLKEIVQRYLECRVCGWVVKV